MALTKRLVKGNPLTFAEGDNNLTYLEGLATNTGSFAVTNAPNNFQGDQAIFGNLIVYGTSSVSYTSQSQTNIGSNLLVLNTDTPSVRFGGLVVYDSGSTQLSGSLLWDSIRHYWIYNTPSGSNYDGAMLISGPKNTIGLGNEQGLLLNVITKGQGTDHITSSALIEDGTTLYVAVNSVITGSLTTTGTITGSLFGTSSYAVSASQAISSSYALSASYALSSSYSFTGSFAQNARSASYALTSSYTRNAELLDGLDSTIFSSTASFTNFTASITNYTASNDLMIADILIATASLNAATSSLYEFTSSVNLAIADILVETASLQQVTASLYAFTASILNNTGSSNANIASLNAYTSSLNAITSSFATTGSNVFTADQTIQGTLTVNKIVVQTVTASQTYSSGSNVFGNLLTNTQTFTGSLQVTGSSHYVLGQLGVGTITPGFTLHLSKAAENNIAIDNTANNNRLLISSRTNNTSILSQNPNTLSPVDLVFTLGTTDTMRVSAASVNITGSLTVSGSGTFNNIGPANFSGSVYSTGSLFNINSVSTNISSSLNVTGSTFNWNGSQVVTLAASQTISGAKTFSAATVFSSTTSHTGTAGFGAGSPTAIDGADGRIITDKIRLYANGQPATQYHNIASAATQNRDITIPNASGTMALLENAQTFSGEKTFTSNLNITVTEGAQLNISSVSAGFPAAIQNFVGGSFRSYIVTTASEFVLGNNMDHTLKFQGVSNNKASLIFSNSANYSYTYPNASGTMALTSDLSAYLPLTGGTLTGNVSITTSSSQLTLKATNTSAGGALLFRGTLTGGTEQFQGFITAVPLNASVNTSDLSFNTYNNGSIVEGLRIAANGAVTAAGLAVNGDITATGNITAYFSDARLKKDLQSIDSAVSKVMSLTGYTYYTNDLGKELLNITKDEKQVGLVAQDLQKVLPEAVKLAPFDRDEDGNSKSGENYLTIQYEKIVPLLIEAIKEQQAQIEELKAK
jgi:hypothetical protein